MDLILGVILGWLTAYLVVNWFLTQALTNARQEMINLLEQVEKENPTVEARVEEQEGVFLVYDAKDETFLAQGNSLTELKQRLDARFTPETTVRLISTSRDTITRLQSSDEKSS